MLMARGTSTFRQRDITEAIKGAVAAGLRVMRVEVDRNGKIIIVGGTSTDATAEIRDGNEWDHI